MHLRLTRYLCLLAALALGGAGIAGQPQECANATLSGFDELLVLAPHPDDEVLGFSGLMDAYRRRGKPVRIVVVTDGDAYCEACGLWKNASLEGMNCDASELANFATRAVDSFAEVRRGESVNAAALVGLPTPRFLGLPDTGLAAAWANREAGEPDAPLRRSDFSACAGCDECDGYGAGPASAHTARSLEATLGEILADTSPGALVATTHWLDGHGDHAALGEFTRSLVAELGVPRAQAYAVIHAHTPRETAHPDCWYPQPGADVCPCMDSQRATDEPRWWTAQRDRRFQPGAAASLPNDADYGPALQLCLAPEFHTEQAPGKLGSIEAFPSQLGYAAREGELPEALRGILDCSGYLVSFAKRTEAFVFMPPDEM